MKTPETIEARIARLVERWEKHADYLESLDHEYAVDHAETLREDYLPELRDLCSPPRAMAMPEPMSLRVPFGDERDEATGVNRGRAHTDVPIEYDPDLPTLGHVRVAPYGTPVHTIVLREWNEQVLLHELLHVVLDGVLRPHRTEDDPHGHNIIARAEVALWETGWRLTPAPDVPEPDTRAEVVGYAGCGSWLPRDPNVAHVDREPCAVRVPHANEECRTQQQLDVAERNAGLYPKYHVARLNDPDRKHRECRYFVLDPQHDPAARAAVNAYAKEARALGFRALADDLDAWVPAPAVAEGTDAQCVAPPGNLCTETGCWDADRCVVALLSTEAIIADHLSCYDTVMNVRAEAREIAARLAPKSGSGRPDGSQA